MVFLGVLSAVNAAFACTDTDRRIYQEATSRGISVAGTSVENCGSGGSGVVVPSLPLPSVFDESDWGNFDNIDLLRLGIGIACALGAGGWFGDTFCNSAFASAADKLYELFEGMRGIVYALAMFAFIGFAIAAMLGKLDWKKVALLGAALFLLAIAENVVSYIVG